MSRLRLIGFVVLLGAVLSLGCGDDPIKPQLPDPFAFASATELIDGLATAYQTQNIELFELLFANNPECKAEFLFFLSEPSSNNETQWGFNEELRLHERMFNPQSLDPDAPEVPASLWLESIMIDLQPTIAFAERRDLYESAANPGGLDPNKWKAMDAKYTTFVLFVTAGLVDFIVEGEANFIVVEDLAKAVGTRGRFLILRWEDLDTFNLADESNSWSNVKEVYR